MPDFTIDRIGHHGDGIADTDGGPVYVPFALPGEQVDATLEGSRGTLTGILAASPDRVDPFCPYFGVCGGCQLQHMAPPAQLGFKRDLVVGELRRAGIDTEVAPTVATADGRRRVTLHARDGRVGLMRRESHELVDIEICPILVPSLQREAPAIARAVHKLLGADAEIAFTDTGLVDVAIRTKRKLQQMAGPSLGRQFPRIGRIAVNGVMVHQSQPPTLDIGRAQVKLPIESFLQPTAAGEAALAELVLAGIGKAKHVADLFSGLGTFALRLAPGARIYAADGDRLAIAALLEAVRNTSGFKPVEARVRDLFREPLTRFEMDGIDAVVFDPPRAGAEAQARELAASRIRTVVGVSCEPRTFARDAAILVAGGLRLVSVTPVDQFAHAAHVELVGVFRR